MKKYFAIPILLVIATFQINAQSRGLKIGYIDMEYILENVPDYSEAKVQLELKADKWKQEIESKKAEIARLKESFATEKALLTKELVDEREEEIKLREDELLDFQQKKFGPGGDLITQKSVLVKPIQDQVFSAVQDIAELKKYDYIFDKSSDLTMLFASKRLDISEQVLRKITRSSKKEKMTKKQLKEEEAKENKEDMETENPTLAARRKALEEKKLAREKLIEEKKEAAEAKKAELEEKRKKILEDKEAKKTGTVSENEKTTEASNPAAVEKTATDKAAEKAKILEDRKKAIEERRQKTLEEREAARKARETKTE